MATDNEVKDLSGSCRDLCQEIKRVQSLCAQFLANNMAKSVDWGAVEFPNPTVLDSAGNIDGFDFSPTKMANAIGSIAAFADTLWNDGHKGNIELMCRPIS